MSQKIDHRYKKKIVVSTLVTLIPVLVGLFLWSRFPEQIPTHFDMNGVADGWSGKGFTVFGLPLIMTVIHVIVMVVVINDPKHQGIGNKMFAVCTWLVPVISCGTMAVIYGIALGMDFNVTIIVHVLIGFLFIVLGNYMTKIRQNYTVGIKLPWTLNSRENWNKTHRIGGRIFILSGILVFANIFAEQMWILVAALVIPILIPTVYSFALYKKGI